MIKSSKFKVFVLMIMLVLSSILFVACNEKDYSKTTLSASTQYVEVFKNNTQQFSVTIQNPVGGMSNEIIVTNSNSLACKIEQDVVVDYTTTYTITGLNGGVSKISFTTKEGKRELDVTVQVREYSETLSKASNSLYVSASKTLQPSSVDFTFQEFSTERDLEYYFYGKTTAKDTLTLEDLQDNNIKQNSFVKADLKTIGEKDYLIFQNKNGNLFTLGTPTTIPGTNNQRYVFISVMLENGEYSFDKANATNVTAGDKFTFIAKYDGAQEGNVLMCERDFYVLIDINQKSFSHEYGYKLDGVDFVPGELTSYKIENNKSGAITLIPDYKTVITDQMLLIGKKAVYATAYLEVTVNSINDLLKVSAKTENTEVANSIVIKEVINNDTKTYYIEINCAIAQAKTTKYNLTFYYEGFEDSADNNVNYTYSVPVEIRVIPTNLLVNNVDYTEEENVYTFYNYYSASTIGWQQFNFKVIPEGAEFDTLVVDLTNSDLQLRYRNVVYSSGQVVIENIYEPVYIKGLDGADVTAETKQLPIKLGFNIISQDSMTSFIRYRIVKGATILDYKSNELEENVYIEKNGGKVLFSDLYADAEFSTMTFALSSGKDVVRFEYDANEPYKMSGYDYKLNFHIVPLANGTGSYTIMLDNGKMTTINVTVLESLKEVSISSTNEDNSITLLEEIIANNAEKSTIVYVHNKGKSTYFDVEVIANHDPNSTAIQSVTPVSTTPVFDLSNASINSQNFNINLKQNGSGLLNLSVNGYFVENFRCIQKTINYTVEIVSYDLIGKMNVYKQKDGFGDYSQNSLASYANVYSNTSNESAREVLLNVGVQNSDAYLFQNPNTQKYIADKFNNSYVYWESDAKIFNNGIEVNRMYYVEGANNVYTIGNYGTFDTQSMKFTAFSSLPYSGSFRLIAHIRQYRNLYSYTTNVKINLYEEVERVTLQSPVEELEFSTLERVHYLIAQPTNLTATNGEIVALFNGGTILADEQTYSILDENSISYLESDGKTQIKLTLSEEFLAKAAGYTQKMQGDLVIVAKDWLDSAGNLIYTYQDLALHIEINFANGTEQNRFTIRDADDLYSIKDNLSAHYKLKTTIDASNIVSKLPLGNLTGSIIGENEYATITGLNITSNTTGQYAGDGESYFGLFNSIAEGAYIEYVQFEGAFNIGSISQPYQTFANIGIIAGANYGKLINVGVTTAVSNIYIKQGNVGGAVGINYGTIKQDFTLFEDNNSAYRSEKVEAVKLNEKTHYYIVGGQGRLSYANFTPKITVFMKDYLNVSYQITLDKTTKIGGVVGLNQGLIQKVDSKNISLTGYSNYMAYSLIKATPSNLSSMPSINSGYMAGIIGGLAGESTPTVVDGSVVGQIYAGFNNNLGIFDYYDDYIHEIESNGQLIESGNFAAGNGMVVGGDVWGYGFVGGVVGRMSKFLSSDDLAGITARTYIRGQKAGSVVANIALIANIQNAENDANLNNAFAIQSVDIGKTCEEASMAILYHGDKIEAYTNDINKLGFGNFANKIDVLNGFEGAVATENKPINVFTYVISREKIKMTEGSNLYVTNLTKDSYYGEYIVIGVDMGNKLIVDQKFFAEGAEENLSLLPKFNNKMSSLTGNMDVYFTYYYQVASSQVEDLSSIQEILDLYMNKISLVSKFYPFITNGEMTFTSRNTDILTIDQTGKITIKKTGLAQVSASSVLNSNDALSFYIYVVNYFNSEYDVELNENKTSIIYPNLSSTALALDKTEIKLRGENNATLYVKPDYSLEYEVKIKSDSLSFTSDKNGNVDFYGVVFSLSANDNISASVIENLEEGEASNLNIEIIGQTITLRKLVNTQEDVYDLIITPQLQLKIDNETGFDLYYNNINKIITDTVVDYKFGALAISNKNYNNVPIYTSEKIIETITIESTDINEASPKYHILGLDKHPLQGNVDGLNYALSTGKELFNVTFTKDSTQELDLGRYKHTYTLKIEINTNSQMFKDRYETNIYGRYSLYVETDSNASKNLLISIDFDRTNVFSIVVDNFTSLNDATADNGIGSSSKYAFPGESGLLEITITPEDSDFEYILIENDDQNYEQGYSSAQLGLLARKKNAEGDANMFVDGTISGSLRPKGILLALSDIVKFYSNENYIDYNGVIYLKYNMTSNNVVDGSKSKLHVKLLKDGYVIENSQVSKELTIKLKNYIAVELDGKVGDSSQTNYYMAYNVARGLKYKLNINSYGFRLDNVSLISSDPNLGVVTQENGAYYLQITSSTINYPNNEFELSISVSQMEGEVQRTATSKTKITVNEYVLNYNGETTQNEDIVNEMGDGIVNIQVGSQTTFGIDLYDYIEYDSSNTEVVNKINEFFVNMAKKGKWTAYTNLISDDQPNYKMADGTNGKTYIIGYDDDAKLTGKNYYFNFDGLNVLPVRTHLPEEHYYYFEYEAFYGIQNGNYVCMEYTDGLDHTAQMIKTKFVLNVYTSSSEASPIPVYDYEDLLNMQKGGYYILLNDITIPTDKDENGISLFRPISGNFASFDGNGHTINMGGTYNMGNLSAIGLFGTISEGTVVKNLILNLTSAPDGNDVNTDAGDTTYALYGLRTIKFITTADSFIFGSIAAENSGIITNCKVSTDVVNGSEYYLTVKADNALTGTSYVAGLVGSNNGYITNCGVEVNIKAPYNLAGVVAQNYRKISACYFKEGKIINNSQFNQHAAGFAISNSNDAQILACYVSGEQTNTSLYSQDNGSYIKSTLAAAGFIYENKGKIQDCYTDIDLSQTTSEMAGFAYKNAGTIKNSFSLSVLRNNVTASAGFAKINTIEGQDGIFSNCYYLYNEKGGSISEGFLGEDSENINTSLYNVDYEGVEKLRAGQFNEIDKYFADYSYQETMGTNAVWFHSKGHTSSIFVDYIPTTETIVIEGTEGNTQTNTIFKTEVMTFGLNRLELVNANIKTLATRNFSYSEYDQATGDITYFYIDDANAPNKGTLHNPRLISNAQNMESEILQQTASTNINTTHYRMISDIDYSSMEGHSGLYKVIFAGMLEGNGMEISQISLVSMDQLESAGMFAQIGYSANKTGIVKNLTITPKEVAFNSTISVGALAGTLKYGEVYNITVKAVQGSSPTISGTNFVGGIVGRAVSSFVMKDVYSHANVSASYSPVGDNTYVEGKGSLSNYSYAGSIAGFVGNGTVHNAHVEDVTSVMGSRVGFAYGGIGAGGRVSYTFVKIPVNSKIKAYNYGGYICGEVSGSLSNSYVPYNGNDESTFDVVPKTPLAVGGITGRLNGGKIINALMQQNFRAIATGSAEAIKYVGGIVGIVSGGSMLSTINEVVVSGEITASNILGGGVGYITSPLLADSIAIKSTILTVKGQRVDPYLGGIVGYMIGQNSASLTLKNSYCTSNLEVITSTSGVQSTARVGGLIASTDNRKPSIYYCYTTSKINAQVYDSRQTGSIQDFAAITDKEKYGMQATFSYLLDNKAEISSEYKSEYDTVYYLGSSEIGSVDGNDTNMSVYTQAKTFVSFSTKVKNTSIGLTVNNYGKSSMQYSSDFGAAALGTSDSALYNLYGNNMQLDDGQEVIDFIYKKNTNSYFSDVEYVEDENTKGTYYSTYPKKDQTWNASCNFESNNNQIDTDSGLLIKYIYDGKIITYSNVFENGVETRFFEIEGKKKYIYDENQKEYMYGNEKLDFSKLTMRKEFKVKDLVRNILVKDSNVNYYEEGLDTYNSKVVKCYKNIDTGKIYYENDEGKFVTADGKELTEIPTIEVWVSSNTKFSTLSFEKGFNWINKI